MNEGSATEQTAYAAVDEALRTYPLAPAPPTLSPAVMARVRGLAAAPRFRVMWLDYALSLFAAGLTGLLLLLVQAAPAWLVLRVQLQFLQWGYFTPATVRWGALFGGGGLALAALAAAGLFLLRPRFRLGGSYRSK